MSYLTQIQSGRIQKNYFLLIYSTDGIGKTTWASQAPGALFLDLEHGSAELDVSRLPHVTNFSEVLQMMDELLKSEHSYQTLVIDALDSLESLIWKSVVEEAAKKDKSIRSIEDLGYGKGFSKAVEIWVDFLSKLNELRERMHVILIGHAFVKTFQDPQTNSGYDRYTLKLNDKAAARVREAVDAVLFANFETYTQKDDTKKMRAYGEGVRKIYTERRPAFDAKNRYGLSFELPLDWQAFDEAARKGEPDSAEAIRNRIEGLLVDIRNQEIVDTVKKEVDKAKEDVKRLSQFENRLKQIVSSQEAA